jgi:hypothetical protein
MVRSFFNLHLNMFLTFDNIFTINFPGYVHSQNHLPMAAFSCLSPGYNLEPLTDSAKSRVWPFGIFSSSSLAGHIAGIQPIAQISTTGPLHSFSKASENVADIR